MSDQKPSFFTSALIGGAIAGILSGLPFLNCLCCVWIIGGAMLAAYLLAKNSPVALSVGDGAIVGIFTGIVAAIVETFVNIPLKAFNREFFRKLMERVMEYTDEVPSGWENWMEGGDFAASTPSFFLGLVISVAIFSALGALGGILGISLFGKKPPQTIQGVQNAPEDPGDRQP
jgi:hypothetical protein